MNYRFISFALCFLMASSTLPLQADEDQKPVSAKEPVVTEIGLSVGFGALTPPWEQFTLRSNGMATKFIGEGLSRNELQSYSAVVSTSDFQQLEKLIKSQHFSEMKESYPIAYPVNDVTTYVIEDGQQKKVITDVFQVPVEMWTIQMAIRGVVSTLRWTKDETSPAQQK